jgi:hypothetical protein
VLAWHGESFLHARRWRSSRPEPAPCVMTHVLVGAGERSCEVETCRRDPSCGELVGDAANWPETERLASVGLDRGP